MRIAIYAPSNEKRARDVIDNLLKSGVCADICLHRGKGSFLRQLCTPDRRPDACILTPNAKADLTAISEVKDLMSRALRIIFVPDRNSRLRAYARSFHPHLLLANGESSNLVTLILAHLSKKNGAQWLKSEYEERRRL